VIGFVGGIPRLPTNLALVKGAALLGVDIRQFSQLEPATSQANMRALFDLFEAGKMPAAPTEVYPLERFAEAMAAIKKAEFVGRAALAVRT
jgi:NADPH2:quinone reductase